MNRTKMYSPANFDRFVKQADAVTTTWENTLGTYDAVAWYGTQAYRVSIAALDPTAKGYVQEITQVQADELIS